MITSFHNLSFLLTLAALFGFLNWKILHLPRTVGIFICALATSTVLILVNLAFPTIGIRAWARGFVESTALPDVLLNVTLGFLLFAGALEVSFTDLWSRKFTILLLATAGVMVTCALTASALWIAFRAVQLPVPFLWCLLLGAVTAPTDPVAVLGVLGRIGVPAQLRAVIAGESLFNDGVAVILFGTLVAVAVDAPRDVTPGGIALHLLREAGGGGVLGLLTGYAAYALMRRINEHNVELMISIALVTGTYSLAQIAQVSGPIATVTAGILIGNFATKHAMSDRTREHLDLVWSVIDDILNALLFLVLGMEIVVLEFSWQALAGAIFAIVISVPVRLASIVSTTFVLYGSRFRKPPLILLTWAGLRGGVSVALALSLPRSPYRDVVMTACYGVVLFSIVVQGLTLEPLARRYYRPG